MFEGGSVSAYGTRPTQMSCQRTHSAGVKKMRFLYIREHSKGSFRQDDLTRKPAHPQSDGRNVSRTSFRHPTLERISLIRDSLRLAHSHTWINLTTIVEIEWHITPSSSGSHSDSEVNPYSTCIKNGLMLLLLLILVSTNLGTPFSQYNCCV